MDAQGQYQGFAREQQSEIAALKSRYKVEANLDTDRIGLQRWTLDFIDRKKLKDAQLQGCAAMTKTAPGERFFLRNRALLLRSPHKKGDGKHAIPFGYKLPPARQLVSSAYHLEVVLHQRLHSRLVEAIAGAVDGLDAVLVVPHVQLGTDIQLAPFAEQRLARIPLDLDRGAD